LALALQGYDLLEKKREILVIELLKRIDELELLEDEIRKTTEKAYGTLKKMLLSAGRERSQAISALPARQMMLKASRVNVSGMNLPVIDAQAGELKLHYSFLNSFAVCDETMIEFTELVSKLAVAASLRSIVWRLAREVKKTQRRVNALDKLVIPRSKEIVSFIEASLDERDRESLFAIKMLKQHMSEEV
ncbi:MAG: V-type ATP synthase subunit D, partial [Spirochaetia bacterium]|nr:V-type ATP synthase subunit D [Spirochaetia bacterium]